MTEDIRRKYSDPPGNDCASETTSLFAIDSGSPASSVALLWNGGLQTREFGVGESSGRLLSDLDELLALAGGSLVDLSGLVALRGPGSFTGLRVGLATILGLHQALGTPATAVTTFEALAWQARRRRGASRSPIATAVDALRGERFVQTFDGTSLEPLEEPTIRSDATVAALPEAWVIGFGLSRIRALARTPEAEARLIEAEPLATDLAARASTPPFEWDAALLTEPLYLRPPAVTARPVRR